MSKGKVLVGLSGGVDSAVAAYLLIKEGYEVSCCFMRNWDAQVNNDYLGNPTYFDNVCPQEKDYQYAQKVANVLGVPLLRVDYIKEYYDNVFSYLIKEYKNGRTPNPDILCNKYIKFDYFLKFAIEKGFDFIATGHYAKKVLFQEKAFLAKPKDLDKDQTYFLCQLNNYQIGKTLFPLENLDKKEVRDIAKNNNLVVFDKKDSTGVCFIGERNFKEFLKNYIPSTKGDIVDINTNKVIGKHDGSMYFTIGQRHGLSLGGVKNYDCKAWYVCKKDIKKNIVYVSNGDEDEFLFSTSCFIVDSNILIDVKEPVEVEGKFRYRSQGETVILKPTKIENKFEVVFKKPLKAITPGQEAVFYIDGVMIGGGVIDEVFKNGKKIL